ncbi:SDR family NAD(P)-dependent oxidoreductase [Amycolatopsis sp. QT-25]|uniref:SDR family NAD(P)-dependent oxidoreductase n=1 Tax=Amycolatopsis sp. QT-25 TaxID=3034022 RepID=UPI0023EB8DE0|nr:SDR family NAD(P)-dependent oxidoreductase [Amycolatopsis sp. QT-25]WET76268.1 SDR family NAD(P)-dependent oxidoreductase [Amycolatopsis sp. QT-25]
MRVLVTGGASGIGAAIVRRFVDDGADVAILDRDENALAQALRDEPRIAFGLTADVADAGAVRAAFEDLDRHWSGLDVLFNNAGISARATFLETTEDQVRNTFSVNLTGVFLVAQQAASRMFAAGSGIIVNTASVSGLVGMPGYAPYNASKAGVLSLTQTLALELAPRIRVNAICPGYVLTPMQEAEYSTEELRACEARIPLGRWGRPAEIAALGAYLVSPDAAFITGQAIVIDGGETAGGLASMAG